MVRWRTVITAVILLSLWPLLALAQETEAYRAFPLVGSRVAVWVIAQLHLMFAAFVLAVPIFAVIVEYMGMRLKNPKFDRLAREFTKLLFAAFSTTAILGAILLFTLIGLYPKFFTYLSSIFFPTMWLYAVLFFGETFSLYLYWHTWDRLQDRKRLHLTLGLMVNFFGTVLMVIANSWLTFMTSPAGVDVTGKLINLWAAINNPTWMAINIHRFIANISFGGAICGAYAAYKFLGAKSDEERAHYDWMGYIGNFIAISALIFLPFAGYLLGRELYDFNQQMGIMAMGGFLSWLWIIQAILIGILFLGSNYYLWLGMERIKGGERYRRYIKYLMILLAGGFLVWATPHSLVASLEEARKIGTAYHPLLGVLGVMSAKNTAVNIMILTTFVSFLLYRRANKEAVVSWEKLGKVAQAGLLAISGGIVIYLGIYGYFVEAIVRIGFSVYQVISVLTAMVLVGGIDLFLYRGARITGAFQWGKIAVRSQYTLVLLAITFTWLMGLMGYFRSAIRQHWHVYGIIRDTSPDAFSPTLGYAANVVSVTTVIFLGFLLFIFWLGGLGDKKPARPEETGKGKG